MSRSLALFTALVIGVAFGSSSAQAGRDRGESRGPARVPSSNAEQAPAQAIAPPSQGMSIDGSNGRGAMQPQWQNVGPRFDARDGRVPLERRNAPSAFDMQPRQATQQPTYQAQPMGMERRAVESRQPIGLAADEGVTSRGGRDVPRRVDAGQAPTASQGSMATPYQPMQMQPVQRDARAVDTSRGNANVGASNPNQGNFLPRSVMGPSERGTQDATPQVQPMYRRAVGERAAIDRPAAEPMVSQPQPTQWRNVGSTPNADPVIRSEAARAISSRPVAVSPQAYPSSSPVQYYRPQPVERSSRSSSSFSIGVGYSDYSGNSAVSTSFSYSNGGYYNRGGYAGGYHHGRPAYYCPPAPVYAIPAATVVTYPTYSYYTPYYCPPPVLVAPPPVVYIPPPVYYVTPAPVYYAPSPCYYTPGLSFSLSFFGRF